MPLTRKGKKVLESMRGQYGPKKGTSVFYASAEKGTIKGVHRGGKAYAHRKAMEHHSPLNATQINDHKELRNEVAGGLRSMSFGTIRRRQPGPAYADED